MPGIPGPTITPAPEPPAPESSRAIAPSPPPGDGEVALHLRDDRPSAALAAIALPREAVLARRRAPRRLLPGPRRLRPPLGALSRSARGFALALPPLLMLAVALGAAVTGIGSLAQVLSLALTLQFARVSDTLVAIDASGRAFLACLGYFALLLALRVLARGLFGSGWARLALPLGLLLALPSAWLFIAGEELAAVAPPLSQIAPEWWRGLVFALTLHATLLAVIGARSVTLVPAAMLGLVGRRAGGDPLDDSQTEPLPLVRFGPRTRQVGPQVETAQSDTQAMRVAGLLHALAEGDAPAREGPTAPAEEEATDSEISGENG